MGGTISGSGPEWLRQVAELSRPGTGSQGHSPRVSPSGPPYRFLPWVFLSWVLSQRHLRNDGGGTSGSTQEVQWSRAFAPRSLSRLWESEISVFCSIFENYSYLLTLGCTFEGCTCIARVIKGQLLRLLLSIYCVQARDLTGHWAWYPLLSLPKQYHTSYAACPA